MRVSIRRCLNVVEFVSALVKRRHFYLSLASLVFVVISCFIFLSNAASAGEKPLYIFDFGSDGQVNHMCPNSDNKPGTKGSAVYNGSMGKAISVTRDSKYPQKADGSKIKYGWNIPYTLDDGSYFAVDGHATRCDLRNPAMLKKCMDAAIKKRNDSLLNMTNDEMHWRHTLVSDCIKPPMMSYDGYRAKDRKRKPVTLPFYISGLNSDDYDVVVATYRAKSGCLSDSKPLPAIHVYASSSTRAESGEKHIDGCTVGSAPDAFIKEGDIGSSSSTDCYIWNKYINSLLYFQKFAVSVPRLDGHIEMFLDGIYPIAAILIYKSGDYDESDLRNTLRSEHQACKWPEKKFSESPATMPSWMGDDAFAVFPWDTDKDIYPNTSPPTSKPDEVLDVSAAQGERKSVSFGLYPAKGMDISKLDVNVSGVKCINCEKPEAIPKDVFDVRIVRYGERRWPDMGASGGYMVKPYTLHSLSDAENIIDIETGVTRWIWITISVPQDQPAGSYQGDVNIAYGSESKDMQLHLDVYPFKLDVPRTFNFSLYGEPNPLLNWNEDSNKFIDAGTETSNALLKNTIKNVIAHGFYPRLAVFYGCRGNTWHKNDFFTEDETGEWSFNKEKIDEDVALMQANISYFKDKGYVDEFPSHFTISINAWIRSLPAGPHSHYGGGIDCTGSGKDRVCSVVPFDWSIFKKAVEYLDGKVRPILATYGMEPVYMVGEELEHGKGAGEIKGSGKIVDGDDLYIEHYRGIMGYRSIKDAAIELGHPLLTELWGSGDVTMAIACNVVRYDEPVIFKDSSGHWKKFRPNDAFTYNEGYERCGTYRGGPLLDYLFGGPTHFFRYYKRFVVGSNGKAQWQKQPHTYLWLLKERAHVKGVSFYANSGEHRYETGIMRAIVDRYFGGEPVGMRQGGYLIRNSCGTYYDDFCGAYSSWGFVQRDNTTKITDELMHERLAEGMNDYDYIYTLQQFIKEANKSEDESVRNTAVDADKFLNDLLDSAPTIFLGASYYPKPFNFPGGMPYSPLFYYATYPDKESKKDTGIGSQSANPPISIDKYWNGKALNDKMKSIADWIIKIKTEMGKKTPPPPPPPPPPGPGPNINGAPYSDKEYVHPYSLKGTGGCSLIMPNEQ